MRNPQIDRAARFRRTRLGPVLPVIALIVLACNLTPAPVATPAPAASATSTSVPTVLAPGSKLGTSKNPLILVLPPTTQTSTEVLNAGQSLVGLLEKATNYTIVSVVPPTETDLVRGFGAGNAHIGVLSPFAYLLASGEGTAEAAFARQHGKDIFYGAQFIARSDAGFTDYFDPLKGANTADSPIALGQFQHKKPCWTDELSASGYVVPLGLLNSAHVETNTPAFLAGHVAVVRAIAAAGICDFGATYIDARTYPGLEDQYPDLLKNVHVIWRIAPIIPYETLVFVHGMDEDMRRNLTRAFVDIESTPDGKSAMQILYGFDAMQVVQDSDYDAFRKAVKASGLDLNRLIK
jgi:ABC-type phosphate/phosphonate transport system substrate-binding protein